MVVSKDNFRKIIKEIADHNDCGMDVFVHRETLKLVFIPNEFAFMYSEYGEGFEEDLDEIERNFGFYFKIEPPSSNESYDIMAEFIERLDEGRWKDALISAINRRKPFANFKHIIDQSPIREKWFSFKHAQLEDRVSVIFQGEFLI